MTAITVEIVIMIMRIIKAIIITIMMIMIILWWWIIMNKSLPHFLNGGKCITEGGLQPPDSLGAGWRLSVRVCVPSFEPSELRQHPSPLLTSVSEQDCSMYATLWEHFPGDLAVYISHSNSFCAQYLPLPLSRFSCPAPPRLCFFI